MKTSPQKDSGSNPLAREHWDVPIRVRLLPFVEFSHWMDEELERLVDRWLDLAAPCAKKKHRHAAT